MKRFKSIKCRYIFKIKDVVAILLFVVKLSKSFINIFSIISLCEMTSKYALMRFVNKYGNCYISNLHFIKIYSSLQGHTAFNKPFNITHLIQTL